VDLSNGFAEALREELDLRIEAQNMTAVRVAAAAGGVNGSVRIPQPHQPLCTMNVLVMERLDGRALGTIIPSEEIGDRQGLARTLLDTLLHEVMIEGVFHADPHPGNVLLLADGQLGLLDFGSVGRVDAGLRAALQRLLLAAPGFDILAEARRFTTEQLAVERGRLGINVRLLADAGDRRYLTALAHQFILTFLAATLGVMAVLMLGLHGGPTVTHRVTLYAFIGYCLLVFAGILALRLLVLVFRPGAD
jgi:predicted unusual protein kinase regulating ubiquinone biosynthesis (AarF/ABC1/UbiB family)